MEELMTIEPYDLSDILGPRAERIQRRFERMNWIGCGVLILAVAVMLWL